MVGKKKENAEGEKSAPKKAAKEVAPKETKVKEAKSADAAPKKSKKVAPKSAAVTKTGTPTVNDYSILVSPVITEKSSLVGTPNSKNMKTFVFIVHRRADKVEIRAAIEKVFKVNVTAVRTVNYMGKVKRTNRSIGRRSAFKKAYVTLQPGQSISVVEGL